MEKEYRCWWYKTQVSRCIQLSKTNTICSYFGELFNKSRDHSWFLTPKDVRWFFHVVRLWKAIKKLGPLVSSRLSFVVSNGQRVSFWKDKWCGTTPLCDSFPSLFALATPKEAWVKDVWIVSQSREMGGVAALASLGLSMIGRWMRWRGYCYVCVGREWIWMRRIGCSDWNWRTETSW